MKAVVLERKGELRIRDIEIPETMGPDDVRIDIGTVGICGSDVHYYEHGAIGPYVVKEPMVLGHEAAGIVTEVGGNVTGLAVGDRVCMEPGIPSPTGRATRLGIYNLDPSVRFWATPPVHGCLRPSVVHPAAFTFKLPDSVSLGEGAIVEPLAIGIHAANKARIKPGDIALVTGAGTIGTVTALAALAGGCSRVIMSDVKQEKLDLAARLGQITGVNVTRQKLSAVVNELTGGWGVDVVFEASGNADVMKNIFDFVCPGGRMVLIGIPLAPIPFDVVRAQGKEVSVETIFRYAHVYPRAVALLGSGKIDVKPLITDVYPFEKSVAAFEYARNMKPTSVKVQIVLKE
jgi:D-xylulose reductase